MFEPVWPKDSFQVLSGNPDSYSLRSTGSGKEVVVHFCGRCGTKLYLSFERFPDALGIYGGTLDDPVNAVADADRTAIFLDEAPKGSVIPAGIKTWRQHKFTNEGNPIEPSISKDPLVV